MDPALRGQRVIAAALASPPLVTIPFIETSVDFTDRRRKWVLLSAAAVAVILVALLLVHLLIIDLDLLFYTLTSKLARL
jgi:hypothetical protein